MLTVMAMESQAEALGQLTADDLEGKVGPIPSWCLACADVYSLILELYELYGECGINYPCLYAHK